MNRLEDKLSPIVRIVSIENAMRQSGDQSGEHNTRVLTSQTSRRSTNLTGKADEETESTNKNLKHFSKRAEQVNVMNNHSSTRNNRKSSGIDSSSTEAAKPQMDRKGIACETCGKTFYRNPNFAKRRSVNSGHRPTTCNSCGDTLKHRTNIRRRETLNSGQRTTPLSECFLNISHTTETNGNQSKLFCEYCGKDFITNWHLKRHLNIHKGEILFNCNDCGKAYRYKKNLAAHELMHAIGIKSKSNPSFSMTKSSELGVEEKDLLCEYCGKMFRSELNYEEHRKVHTDDLRKSPKSPLIEQIHTEKEESAPFLCEYCGEMIMSNYEEHRRAHIMELNDTPRKRWSLIVQRKLHREMSRSFSEESFSDSKECSKLAKDTVHVKENRFVCKDCGKVYRLKMNHVHHIKSHRSKNKAGHGIKSNHEERRNIHVRDEHLNCSKADKKKSNLIDKSQPYRRKIYSHLSQDSQSSLQSSTNSSNLIEFEDQEIKPTGDKDLLCKDCGKAFKYKMHYVSHILKHEHEQLLACEICGKVYRQKRALKKHELEKHVKGNPDNNKPFHEVSKKNTNTEESSMKRPERGSTRHSRNSGRKSNKDEGKTIIDTNPVTSDRKLLNRKYFTSDNKYKPLQQIETKAKPMKGHRLLSALKSQGVLKNNGKPFYSKQCRKTYVHNSGVRRNISVAKKRMVLIRNKMLSARYRFRFNKILHQVIRSTKRERLLFRKFLKWNNYGKNHPSLSGPKNRQVRRSIARSRINRYNMKYHSAVKRLHNYRKSVEAKSDCHKANSDILIATEVKVRKGNKKPLTRNRILNTFQQTSSWEKLKSIHIVKKLSKCGSKLLKLSQVRVRLVNHAGARRFVCRGRQLSGTIQNNGRAHHNRKLISGSKTIKEMMNLQKEERSLTGENRFLGDDSDNTFVDQRSAIERKPPHAGDQPCSNTNNSRAISEKQNLKAQADASKIVKGTLSCKICKKTFSTTFCLIRHGRVHTGEKNYQCKMCGKSYAWSWSLKTHKCRPFETPKTLISKAGNESKRLYCGICSKTFSSSSSLTRHGRVHSNERNYQCKFCGRRYRWAWSIKTHNCQARFQPIKVPNSGAIKNDQDKYGRRFTCEVCSKTFANMLGLKLHRRNHRGEEPCKCERCGKVFRWSKFLKLHRCSSVFKQKNESVIRSEFNDKTKDDQYQGQEFPRSNFPCPLCKMIFTDEADQKHHFVSHIREFPFKCQVCRRSFNHLLHLNKHLKIHE